MADSRDNAFYDRALDRIIRVAAVLGAAGSIVSWVLRGANWAAGFLVGAVISLINFYGWKRLATSLGGSGGKRPWSGSAAFLGLRYLLFAAVIYAIVKLLGITLVGVLAGLFVSVAAILVEIFYELVFTK
jgi:hypothetical protein